MRAARVRTAHARTVLVLAVLVGAAGCTAPRDALPRPEAVPACTPVAATLLAPLPHPDVRALALDARGVVYVAAPDRVFAALPGDSLRRFSGTLGLALQNVRALDASQPLRLVVADESGQIVTLGRDGVVVGTLRRVQPAAAPGAALDRPETALAPIGVRALPDGRLVIVDARLGRLLLVDEAGRERAASDAHAAALPALRAPRALERTSDRLWVLDDDRLRAFDLLGAAVSDATVAAGALGLAVLDDAPAVVHRWGVAASGGVRLCAPAPLRALAAGGDALVWLTDAGLYASRLPAPEAER